MHAVCPSEKQDRKKKKKVRKHLKRCVGACIFISVPILLGLVVFAMMMGIFSTNLHGKSYILETSSYLQMHCPYPCTGTSIAPILVGNFNSFWYELVTISQYSGSDTPFPTYSPQTMRFFKIPAQQLHTFSRRYPPYNKSYNLILDQFYMLKGSTINFTIVVNSTSGTSSGSVNLTICNNRLAYVSENSFKCEENQFTVGPRESKLTFVNFVAPHNSYYYITTKGPRNNSKVVFFNVDINLKFLNSSDWKGVKYKTSSTGDPLNFNLGSMFEAQDYVIVANITTDPDYPCYGQLTVTEHYRSFVYIVPAMVGGGLMCLGLTCTLILCLCYFLSRKVYHRKKHGEKLYDSDTHMD